MAEYQREPFGERVLLEAIYNLTQIVANSARDPKQRPQPYTTDDFRIRGTQAPEAKSPDDLLDVITQWNTALGGKDVRKRR